MQRQGIGINGAWLLVMAYFGWRELKNRRAVALVTAHGYGASEAARNLGVNRSPPRTWKRQLEENPTEAFPGQGRMLAECEELPR
jgi:transposase-like protein